MKHFIADLGPSFPCHPLYDEANTWFDIENPTGNHYAVRLVLNGLAEAGFNGIRLPMWPESTKVDGPNPTSISQRFTRDRCNELSKTIAKVVRDHSLVSAGEYLDDAFWYFSIYYSPAFDSQIYQEDISTDNYTTWVTSYMASDFHADFISPFSANESILKKDYIEEGSKMLDPTSLFEINVLDKIRFSPAYTNKDVAERPKLIGPDRATAEHTLNVLMSYEGSNPSIRPDYPDYVDIIGTQSRYGD